jgi:hypothetical protein
MLRAVPGGMWRQKKLLVTHSETPFPDRCVKCNRPANGFKLKRVLYWQHPAYYLLLLLNLLVLLIVLLIVRKKAVFHVGLCPLHRSQRGTAIIIGWVGGLGGIATSVIGGFAFNSVWVIVAGIVLFLAALIYALLKVPIISAAKITTESVKIKGVSRDFLADLPEWTGL